MHFIISVADSRSFRGYLIYCILLCYYFKSPCNLTVSQIDDRLTFKSYTESDYAFSCGIILSGMFDQ